MKNNYEIEVILKDKIKRVEVDTIKEAIDYMNSFKDSDNLVSIEVLDLESNEVIGRLT